jgi:hypothetical protein
MGTKQLQADRRVADVQVNDAGKATHLTLAPGWSFNGSAGPFALDNVDHGHKIVRGAEPDGSVAVGTRRARSASRKPPASSGDGIPPEPSGDKPPASRATEFAAPREQHVDYCYRLCLVPIGEEIKGQGKEVVGWLKLTQKLSAKELGERTWKMLGHMLPKATAKTHEPKSFRWLNSHQADARKRDELGAPFKDTNFGDK